MHLSFILQIHHSCRLPQILVQTVHGEKVYVGQENIRCVDLLQGNIPQVVHWVKLLEKRQN